MANLTQRANTVRYYDAFKRQWIIVAESDLAAIKSIGSKLPVIMAWCQTAMPDIASTRSLLAIEALAKDGANAATYKLLLDARLVLYDAFRMALGDSFQTATMAAFLQVADAGIQSFVNERERAQFRVNVAKTLGMKAAQALLGSDDALTSLRSFAPVFATAAV
jgi:hypothetical protein